MPIDRSRVVSIVSDLHFLPFVTVIYAVIQGFKFEPEIVLIEVYRLTLLGVLLHLVIRW